MVHPYNGVILSSKMERNIDRWNNLDESQSLMNERIQCPKVRCYMIPFIWHSPKEIIIVVENQLPVARVWGWEGCDSKGRRWVCFIGLMELFCALIMVDIKTIPSSGLWCHFWTLVIHEAELLHLGKESCCCCLIHFNLFIHINLPKFEYDLFQYYC